MSILDGITAKGSDERTLARVASYAVTVEPHTDKAGRRSVGFKVYPVLDDGRPGRFGDLWIRVSEGPDALRALVDALPRILAAATALDERMVKAGEWKARPTPQAPAKPAAKAAPAKPRSILDDLADGLPE